jgi:hypothetical protein
MPLHDHFRPPLSTRRHWHSFHSSWATYISSQINERLPPGYFAEANVQFAIETTDIVEVRAFAETGGLTLGGAVELVSPANKDRPAHRDAFVSKCASYLQQGIGLVIVDVVTERGGNLHDALLARLASAEPPFDAALYATAYRPNGHGGQPKLDIWQEELAVGRALPTLPLCLRGGVSVPVELEATYQRTCREQRVLANGN